MKFVNLTPHAITVGERVIEPSGTIARCHETTEPAGQIDGIEMIYRTYDQVINLPEIELGVVYIVSHLVRIAVPDRPDVVSPGDVVRDGAGRIIGCTNFIMNCPVEDEGKNFTVVHPDGEEVTFKLKKR